VFTPIVVAAACSLVTFFLQGCGRAAEDAKPSPSVTVRISSGNKCTANTEIPIGLCCCQATQIVTYGNQSSSQNWCQDSIECASKHQGFCGELSAEDGLPNWQHATTSFCQFTCPCCVKQNESQRRILAVQQENAWLHQKPEPYKRSFLHEKWANEGPPPFMVSNSTFHKTFLKNVTARYSLQEFYQEEFKDSYTTWDQLETLRNGKGWNDTELAIHMYITNILYRQLNTITREARSMSDINLYWQSYLWFLKQGLETSSQFAAGEVWRGVSPCNAHAAFGVGAHGVLPSFTSTSADRGVAEAFGCVILHFTGGGYSIQSFSAYPSEAEVLLEPGRTYFVRNKTTIDSGQTLVTLETKGPTVIQAPSEKFDMQDAKAERQRCIDIDSDSCAVCTCCNDPKDSQWQAKVGLLTMDVHHDGQTKRKHRLGSSVSLRRR